MTPADSIVNGYFYTFIYKAKDVRDVVDEVPLIYCIGPSTKNINNFVGLNLHHLSIPMRETLLRGMERTKSAITSGSRTIFSESELNSILPGCKIAIREYSRKRVYQCYKIDTKEIPLYIYGDGRKHVTVSDSEIQEAMRKIGILYK